MVEGPGSVATIIRFMPVGVARFDPLREPRHGQARPDPATCVQISIPLPAGFVTLDEFDTVSANNQESASVTPQQGDLSIHISGVPATGIVGQAMTIQITVSNDGPNDATGASLPITLPPGFELVSTTPGQGGFDRETGVWSIGTLAARASVVLALVVEPVTVGAA